MNQVSLEYACTIMSFAISQIHCRIRKCTDTDRPNAASLCSLLLFSLLCLLVCLKSVPGYSSRLTRALPWTLGLALPVAESAGQPHS